jgi:alkanesulfonate monooxygenase SsuD/methylene tetrahydromethanopterin reductase-like flavin-dependent oxidoreductase (luciferase family)
VTDDRFCESGFHGSYLTLEWPVSGLSPVRHTPEEKAPEMSEPKLTGSVSLRLYPHNDLPAESIVAELVGQAALGAASGFDGVMVSEHHGGFSGYLPNPQQVAGWLLEEMDGGWAGACPLLLPLLPVAQVAEEAAWLAARFPGRVILGVAPGSLVDDFEAFEVPHEERMPRYRRQLAPLVALLSGRGDTLEGRAHEVTAGDRAVMRCVDHPVPVLGAAMSIPACERAARAGAGILFDSLSTAEHLRTVADAYRAAGGTGTAILNRRVWVGPPPRTAIDAQVDVYKSYATSQAKAAWGSDELVSADDPAEVAGRLADLVEVAGADALNIRVHSAGMSAPEVRDQIALLGAEVVPLVRQRLAGAPIG